MADMIDIVARLHAYEVGHAVPLASHRRVALHSQALLFCPIVMAGEDTAVHMVLVGQIHQQPHLFWLPDPRNRQDLYALFERLADVIDAYFQQCLQRESYPQMWVSAGTGADLIDKLADRLRFNHTSAKARRLGQLLVYPAERIQFAGQQTLLVAPDVLRCHWATGQQDNEDEHLATLLTWLDPPSAISILDAVEQAERIPSGIKTDPTFDQTTLVPLVTAFNRARRRQASSAELHQRAQRIRDALLPVVRTIYDQTCSAYSFLQSSRLPPLSSLPRFEQREKGEFRSFMRSLVQGYHHPFHDSVRAAAYGLAAREDAVELTGAVLRCEDAVERARGRLGGHILSGVVCKRQRHRVGVRTYQYHFQLLSTQQEIRVRERDEFYWADDLRLKVCVEEIQHQAGGIILTFRILEGMRSVGMPSQGTRMDLMTSRPDWDKLTRERQNLWRRLRPAVQVQGVQPNGQYQGQPGSPASLPADPLRLVEELQ